jgi:hypothetical protein
LLGLRGTLLGLWGPLRGLLLPLGGTFQDLLEDLAENVHREKAPKREKLRTSNW